MDEFDAITLVAELALGVAGFSGVVVALGTRPGTWPEVDRLRLATLLATGIGALFLALIAMLLVALRVDELTIWRSSSLLMAIHGLAILLTIVPRAWAITRQTTGLKSPYSMAVFIPAVIANAANVVAQLANGFTLLNFDPFGVFFAGLIVLLIISAIQFVRLLFVFGESILNKQDD